MPSVVKTMSGYCPNCPCDIGSVLAAMPRIEPVPTVLSPDAWKTKGLLTTEVKIWESRTS